MAFVVNYIIDNSCKYCNFDIISKNIQKQYPNVLSNEFPIQIVILRGQNSESF